MWKYEVKLPDILPVNVTSRRKAGLMHKCDQWRTQKVSRWAWLNSSSLNGTLPGSLWVHCAHQLRLAGNTSALCNFTEVKPPFFFIKPKKCSYLSNNLILLHLWVSADYSGPVHLLCVGFSPVVQSLQTVCFPSTASNISDLRKLILQITTCKMWTNGPQKSELLSIKV